ncbi:OLC1v1030148C1 [Oldenlandia corymbosa var. corymbosa]|nr:OLC1v1030148C1 [Oldenlandia corymbosa var. corymbosa]
MSNNLISQQFQFPDGQITHLDNFTMDAPPANLQDSPMSLNFAVSNGQVGVVDPSAKNSSFQSLIVSRKESGGTNLESGNVGIGSFEGMLPNLSPKKAFLPSKRKADAEGTVHLPQHFMMPNKRNVQQLGTAPRVSQMLQSSLPNSKPTPVQSKIDSSAMQNLQVSNKKMVRSDSISSRSGNQRVQTPKGRTVQNGPSSKAQDNSSAAVRSKMREQLAVALALVSENQDKTASQEKDQDAMSSNPQTMTEEQQPGSVGQDQKSKSSEPVKEGDCISADKPDDTQGFSAKFPPNEYLGGPMIFPDENVSFSDNFFVKDDLLQGNGLSWAFDLDMQLTDDKEKFNVEKSEVVDEGSKNLSDREKKLSPEDLATQIEAELFKLFGGVNKKYKEKGRSLLFNLKDRSNPELRERVVSGEITPERLCTMTAEELASKELTEWRIAKAEELAQMVVLPDTDIDMRRLVKKTHKGEYQVEMEEKDDLVMEVSAGPSEVTQTQTKSRNIDTGSPKLEGTEDLGKLPSQKRTSENLDHSGSLVIPSDGSDLMQGMIVDEFKEAEFLPPIISLDEFMESLHSEPPFENLEGNAGQSTPPAEKEKTDDSNDVSGSDSGSKVHADSPEKTDKEVTQAAVSETVKTKESPVKQNISPRPSVPTAQRVWEGALQLSVSSSIRVFSVFTSGEKTSVAEWPSSLEIKGRVRLDAFEKFVKDLPNSRSRAVMVIHFVLKDNSDDTERASLHEAIESYVTDNRLGFAEPASGVELYLCPTRGRVVDMLSNYVSKDRTDIFNSSDNGLIGVIVWRKAHKSSTISSNSASSHQRHSTTNGILKKQHNTSSSSRRHHQDIDANVKVNNVNKPPLLPTPAKAVVAQPPNDDDDSDIPPGFGPPGGSRDVDDLPEFNFSRKENNLRTNVQTGMRIPNPGPSASRPVDHLRELIHKYGQSGDSTDSGSGSGSSRNWVGKSPAVGAGFEPWNDDDDDDVLPEWRPQPPQTPSRSLHQPLQSPYGNRHLAGQHILNPPMTPSRATVNIVNDIPASRHQDPRWAAQPPGGGGQYYGSRSRGY